jgi:hypothetical protein
MVYALHLLTWRDKWLLILRKKAFCMSRNRDSYWIRASPIASLIHFLSLNLAILHQNSPPTDSSFGLPK